MIFPFMRLFVCRQDSGDEICNTRRYNLNGPRVSPYIAWEFMVYLHSVSLDAIWFVSEFLTYLFSILLGVAFDSFGGYCYAS